MYVALLDTCALWPSRQRDFLLSLAVENVFRPIWSDVTLEELEYHEAEKLRDRGLSALVAGERAAALLDRMRRSFSGATIDTWNAIRPVGLPDVDDEHVSLPPSSVGQTSSSPTTFAIFLSRRFPAR